MNVKSIKSSVLAVMSAAAGVIVSTTAFAAERPELLAYPFKTSVTEGGTYVNWSAVGTDFVISGTISSALTFSSDVPYRVTLDGATVSQCITLSGDATLWLVGDNVIETTAATAVSSTGTLTIGGAGSVTLASSPTKKQTGPVVAENLVVAGGNVSIVLNADVKNVAGITLTGDYVQVAGTVDIDWLGLGADDFIAKPFRMRELLARVAAALRRADVASHASNDENAFRIGDALIDASRFLVRAPGEPDQTLTVRELGLLKTFAAHPGQVLSRDALLDAVWGEDYFAASRTLDQHILQVRRKLGASGVRIETIRGAGYRLRD